MHTCVSQVHFMVCAETDILFLTGLCFNLANGLTTDQLFYNLSSLRVL